MAITYDNPEVNSMGVSPIDRSRMNGEIMPKETLGNSLLKEKQELQLQSGKPIINPMASLGESAVYSQETSNPERAWYQSKYDDKINWNYDPLGPNDLGSKRAEAQGVLGRLKDSTLNNVTILGTTLASDVISLTGGLLSSIIQGDISKMWDNKAVNALSDLQRKKLEERQIFRSQEYENQSAFKRLGSGIFWADLWQNAGYMEGMLIPGMAVGKLARASKLLSNAPEIVTKIGANSIAAIGEASMEALNQKKDSEKDLYGKADRMFREKLANAQNWDEKERLYDEYGKDLKQIQSDVVAIGNRTFAGNVALLTATGTIEFGDFVSRGYVESHKLLQQIARNEAGQAVGKGAFNAVARGLGQTTKNFFSEGFEEYAQRSLSSGASRTRKANGFLEKYQDEFNIELADNYMSAFFQDMYKDLGNSDAWTEFLSGALMGSIGIPGSHNGVYANINDALKENKKMENLANEVNTFELEHGISSKDLNNNGKAQAYFDALIRESGINAVQNQALIDRDKKTFIDSRVEKVLNLAYLYDNIGEIDEFKKRLEWYSKIENEEQKNELIKQTQDVELDDNGNVVKENKQSPFKDMSIEEINQKLKETNDFYQKIVDDYIEGKNFIDNFSKGKLDDETLKRGAASYAQANNLKSRAVDLYKDIMEAITKTPLVISSDKSEDAEFVSNFFNDIKDLHDNEILNVFKNPKTVSSVYALTEYVNRNSNKIDADAIKNIVGSLVDLTRVAYDYKEANDEVNSILKDSQKAQSKTKRIVEKIKQIKKNYTIKRYAKTLDRISDKETLEKQIKNLPNEIRNDVVEFLKSNGNENVRKILLDIDDWDNVSKAISKIIDSFDENLYPVNRKEFDSKYGKDNVEKALTWIKEAFKDSISKNEVIDKLNNYLDVETKAIEEITDADEKLKRSQELSKIKELIELIKKKISEYSAQEKKVSDKKKKNDKINKEEFEDEEDEEGTSKTNETKETLVIPNEIPDYIPSAFRIYLKRNDVKNIKKQIQILKESGVSKLSVIIQTDLKRRGDADGKKTLEFLESLFVTENPKKVIEGELPDSSSKTNIEGVQPSQNEDNGTEPPKTDDNEEKDKGPNVVSSIGISKYNHEEAKKGNLVFYNQEDSIYKLLEEYGAYDFVDNGNLHDYLEYCKKNNIELDDIVKFIKTSIEHKSNKDDEVTTDVVYLLALESDNAFFESQQNQTKKINIAGKNYQVIGMMAYNTNNQKSIDEYEKLSSLINDECGDVPTNEFKLSSLTNSISNINAGRLVYNQNENNGLNELLKNIQEDDFEIGIYDYAGDLFTDSSVNKDKLVQPRENLRTAGTVYLFVKCADGKYYPRQIRAKKFIKKEINDYDLQNDIYIKKIKEHIKNMCNSSLAKGRRAGEKNELQKYIFFDNEKFTIDDLISFDEDKYGNDKIRVGQGEEREFFYINDDDVVDEIFNKIISLKDLKLTPKIHIGESVDYDWLKSLIRKSTLLNSDVKMQSIDCNFELFTTDEDGKINKADTINNRFHKRIERELTSNGLFSFHKEQIDEIYNSFKRYFPFEISNVNTLRVDSEIEGKSNSYKFFINGNLLDESYEELNNILNFIYNSLNEGRGFEDDFYSFNDEFDILFRMSKNSNNTYSIRVGEEAKTEYNKLKKEEEETKKAEEAEKLNSTKTPINTDNEEQPNVEENKQPEESKSVKELSDKGDDGNNSGYIDPTYATFDDDNDKSSAETQTEECGENPPFE